jgi:hypothetical protein
MALSRCGICGGPQGLKQDYPHCHTQVSSAGPDVVCGSPKCTRRAFIWLTDDEQQQYLRGDRHFRVPNRAAVQLA